MVKTAWVELWVVVDMTSPYGVTVFMLSVEIAS